MKQTPASRSLRDAFQQFLTPQVWRQAGLVAVDLSDPPGAVAARRGVVVVVGQRNGQRASPSAPVAADAAPADAARRRRLLFGLRIVHGDCASASGLFGAAVVARLPVYHGADAAGGLDGGAGLLLAQRRAAARAAADPCPVAADQGQEGRRLAADQRAGPAATEPLDGRAGVSLALAERRIV